METRVERKGATFVWDENKARLNEQKDRGISFQQAIEAFFDPFFRVVDADRRREERDALIGYNKKGRLLYVVHVVLEDDAIRLVSARKATKQERKYYDS